MGRKGIEVNKEYFKNIRCRDTAWVAGFLIADGNIYNNRLSLSLHKQDEEVIDKILNLMSSKANKNYYKEYVKVGIYNKTISKDLEKWGVIPRKSLITKYPEIGLINKRDFIRGYFDGDGCIKFNKSRNYISINFKGTFEFLSTIQSLLKDELSINSGLYKAKISDKNTWDLYISGNTQSIKFMEWIYFDTPEEIKMNRKYDNYLNYLTLLLLSRQKPFKDFPFLEEIRLQNTNSGILKFCKKLKNYIKA